MFWEEEEDKSLPYEVSDEVIDLSFSIRCKTLPINHAWFLSKEILTHLPWLENHKIAGIHQIHVAESNNGWLRPDEDDEDALLYPSRRTKLCLRIPINKLEEVQHLTGETLDINKHSLQIGGSKKKPLTNAGVIFSRYILSEKDEDENAFLTRMANEIKNKADFKVKKMLCGKSHAINTPNGKLTTRHLMIAELDNDSSIRIQQLGLGSAKELGCGIFLPHKSIKSLNPSD